MSTNNIENPIEQRNTAKGNPNAILQFDRPLNNRQEKLLEELKEYDSKIIVKKKNVNMKDLAALTAYTGDEFALFTKDTDRLVIRGNSTSVNVNDKVARELNLQGYRWSGHTHPGEDAFCLFPSNGDKAVLRCFANKQSSIYNSKGKSIIFDERGIL